MNGSRASSPALLIDGFYFPSGSDLAEDGGGESGNIEMNGYCDGRGKDFPALAVGDLSALPMYTKAGLPPSPHSSSPGLK